MFARGAAPRAAPGRGAACRKGCHGCCHQPVPVTPPEILGLRLYARELMPPAVRSALASRAAAADSGFSCRFLLAGACGAYPVRPIACRRYIVLGRPCAEGEDASVTRPGDMLRPSRPALNQALALTLPLYAAENPPGPMPGPEAAFAFCSARGVLLSDVSGRILG